MWPAGRRGWHGRTGAKGGEVGCAGGSSIVGGAEIEPLVQEGQVAPVRKLLCLCGQPDYSAAGVAAFPGCAGQNGLSLVEHPGDLTMACTSMARMKNSQSEGEVGALQRGHVRWLGLLPIRTPEQPICTSHPAHKAAVQWRNGGDGSVRFLVGIDPRLVSVSPREMEPIVCASAECGAGD